MNALQEFLTSSRAAWFNLALYTAPLLALVYWKRIYPNVPLVLAMLAPCLLSFGVVIRADIIPLVLALDAAVLLVAAFDLLTLPKKTAFAARRQVSKTASLGKRHPVEIMFTNSSTRAYELWVRDDAPQEFERHPEEFHLRLPARSRRSLHYEATSHRRGAFHLETVYVRARSRVGLWKRFFEYPAESTINVYPDMKQMGEYAILARTNRLSLMGLRRTRKIGQDNEFERLRDYTLDDNYKHIDWRATARRNRVTVKDFQTNQSQRVIFMVDCGRMMTNEADGISLLDHAFNAVLMLSFVALRQGDSVGQICFSDQIHSFTPPRGGMRQMNQLLHASFDRFPRLVESRYDEAFLYLGSHCRKRSLVVLISNVIDEVNSNQLEQYLSTLVGRHLPIGVLLRDRALFEIAEQPNPTESQLYRAAAAAEVLTWRHQVITDLTQQGVMALDVFPEDLTAKLVNQYLEIKARHLL